MHIIHMIAQLRLGAGRHVVEIAKHQVFRLRYDVSVLLSEDAESNWKSDPCMIRELVSAGVPVDVAGDFFHRNLDSLLRASSQVRDKAGVRWERSVIHAHTAMAAAVAARAGARSVVATCHGFAPSRAREFDLQDSLAFQLCRAVITPSEFWAKQLRTRLGVRHPLVIPVGLDLEKYPPPRHRSHSDRLPFRIVVLCELTHRKGVDLLIGAMPSVLEKHPRAELHIIGEGDASMQLRQQACVIDPAGSKIRFHGYVQNPYPFLQDCDLFVLPSRSDNQPLALMEAMLAGLPIVAAQVGGIPEMVLGAGCGVLVEPESASRLAKAIIELLEEGRDTREILGGRGREYAIAHYGIEQIAVDLQNTYRQAAGAGDYYTSYWPDEKVVVRHQPATRVDIARVRAVHDQTANSE